jgi:hypothetical protein
LTLDELQEEVNNLAMLIKTKKDDLPTYGRSRDFGYPHLEVDGSGYHYVVVERGQELIRKTTKKLHQLLFLVFDSVTSNMSYEYELKNRIEMQDCRRMAFKKKLELMNILNPEWAEIVGEEQKKILKEHPYDDLAGVRASYFGELREKGFSEDEINRMAYEKYPEENKMT